MASGVDTVRAARGNDQEGHSVWVDDFEGHWPNIEDVDDGRLVEIRKKTMEAIDDPILLIQQPFTWYWEDQLRRIDSEMRRRGLEP
jgi:predicted nuclease with RNAse H fold